ncbi:MAG TPA: proline--tRNA ligase [Chthonomonadaceae bacterium]|nr:proline--tRNA ligase [Chthonomonadaceae bacterium]
MKASQLFFPTLREVPKEAELTSHQLLVRGGFVRGVAAGVYSYLPLGWRVHEKIAQIVREEANAFGGQELHMPVLVPKELLDETGRSGVPVLFALKDRNQRDFFLGFTHEEVVTDIVRSSVNSWKHMPLYLYQIQTKERDEPRPRGGLIRGREFTMFDGYSFDSNEADLDRIYRANYRAYENVFRRCGLEYLAVEADPGAIGGSENHEFMVLTDSGEDTVLRCDSCDYAANAERAEVPASSSGPCVGELLGSYTVSTPGAHTIDEVCALMNVGPGSLIKTIICLAGGKPMAALVRGDRELNLPKFARLVQAKQVDLADAATVVRVTGAPVGFAGPVGLAEAVPIYADNELNDGNTYIVGANENDAHAVNVAAGRDYAVTAWGDIRTAVAGDACPRCANGHLTEARGIEVGHIFKLGTKYSSDMNAQFQNEMGQKLPIIMGCYGLGVSRTMAAAVEAHNDANGIAWPISIAPFEVAIIVAASKDETQQSAGAELYRALKAAGVDALFDDREDRTGVKFKDMELIGVPIQVIVGKGLAEGLVELGLRGQARESVPVGDAARAVTDLVAGERAKLARLEQPWT